MMMKTMMKTIIKKILKEAHKISTDESVELYRDDDFILTIPLTHSASRKYGSDTKWCTTKRDCDKDFIKHIKLGVLGYIVIRNKEIKEKLGSNAFAIYRLYGKNPNNFITFDDQNNEYRNGENWLSNKFDRYDLLPQYYKMLSKFNQYYESKTLRKKNRIVETNNDPFKVFLFNLWDKQKESGSEVKLNYNDIRRMGLKSKLKNIMEFYAEYSDINSRAQIIKELLEDQVFTENDFSGGWFDDKIRFTIDTISFDDENSEIYANVDATVTNGLVYNEMNNETFEFNSTHSPFDDFDEAFEFRDYIETAISSFVIDFCQKGGLDINGCNVTW